MLNRYLNLLLHERLAQFPAVVLLGPRQVGKTTLALNIMAEHPGIYLDLEAPDDRNKLTDPTLYLKMNERKLVVLDEVQRMPELFYILRGTIDEGRRKGLKAGRFLLLGSASLSLLQQSGESLAGRVAYLELSPFNILEILSQDPVELWVRGGFPDSFLAKNNRQSFIWRENFIQTYLERDIPMLGPRIPAETLRRFWMMLAHCQGGLFNAAQIARSLAVDGKTVMRYLDLLIDLFLVRRLMPWHNHKGKRLVKSPKIFVRDSGILHALLGITNIEQLMSHPIIGSSWEGFVIENLITVAPIQTIASFYRTSAGAEIDLILELPNNELWAIEIKRGLSPKIEKGFYIACEDIAPTRRFVVYPGVERYPIGNDIEVISLRDLATLLVEL